MPRTSIKGQVLADLMAEFAESPEEVEMGDKSVDGRSVGVASIQGLQPWELYVDGVGQSTGIRSGASTGIS